jgi:hypothetical protein
MEVLAAQPSQATIMNMIRVWNRAQRRHRMVRDLEHFLGLRCGGWPLKRERPVNQRKGAEARDAFAAN